MRRILKDNETSPVFSCLTAAQGFGFLWGDSCKAGEEEFLIIVVNNGNYYCCNRESCLQAKGWPSCALRLLPGGGTHIENFDHCLVIKMSSTENN